MRHDLIQALRLRKIPLANEAADEIEKLKREIFDLEEHVSSLQKMLSRK